MKGRGTPWRVVIVALLAACTSSCVWHAHGFAVRHHSRSSYGVTTLHGTHVHTTTVQHRHVVGCGHAYVGGTWILVR